MAIFRGGVKVAGQDIRTGLTKKRGQGILRKLGVLPDDGGRSKFEKDSMGDIQTIRTIMGMGEGFTRPINFRCSFAMPKGIEQQVLDPNLRSGRSAGAGGGRSGPSGPNGGAVKFGSLDWRTHIMNNSTIELFKERYNQANAQAQGMFKQVEGQTKLKRDEQKMNLYCSKVSIPSKEIQTTLPRQYGAPYPWPTGVVYGTITTTFYCDGTMHIKNFFDAWQKLIYNDLTGNFNFYNEYTSHFDVHTRTTTAVGGQTAAVKPKTEAQGWATDLSNNIKEATAKFDEITGQDKPRDDSQAQFKKPKVDFRDNYGVRIFECFPNSVGSIELGHDSASNVSTFDVTWSYRKWNPFKMGGLGNRSEVNLSIGELRNEKDGIPFIEDLPPELAGPLTGAVNQGINTSPMSKASNLLG